jgi:hypothetical protein
MLSFSETRQIRVESLGVLAFLTKFCLPAREEVERKTQPTKSENFEELPKEKKKMMFVFSFTSEINTPRLFPINVSD